MKILVIGSTGQLGQTFKNRNSVNNNYCFSDRNDFNLLDRRNTLNFLDKKNPDVIINCAAYTNVEKAESEKDLAFSINYEAVKTISKWSYNNKAFLIHFSTDYVFDGKKQFYDEYDPPNPLSVYGESKLFGEEAFLNSTTDGICLRTSWVHSNYGKNFFLTMKNLFQNVEIVKVVNDQSGIPTTTHFLVKITEKLIKYKNEGKQLPKILHACPTGKATWYDFALLIYQCMNNDIKLKCKKIIGINSKQFPQLARRPANSVLSNKKLTDIFDLKFNNWLEEHKVLYKEL